MPEEMLADTLYTGDENVEAAATRGVDLVGPVPGRPPESDPETLSVDDFALGRADRPDRCLSGGPRADVVFARRPDGSDAVRDAGVGMFGVPISEAMPDRQITNDGTFTLDFSDKERRLAGRRVEEATEVFKERYAARSGIESTNSGLKNRLGLGHLRVRGRGSVFRVLLHKVAGWNVLRAAASEKLRAG